MAGIRNSTPLLASFRANSPRTVPDILITGLNGSGKSNILDAICFVLGISNLSAVRAANLQDLVYKRGQAGVTKATVTIDFNNEDPNTSPFGYHQYKTISVTRQIVIGGRNKWLVNGHAATQQTIQNLFQSVSLNVNNPHFLIMQGRITKVLNMKPPEILAMIEEAAGTRMYEEKKRKALETIEKKDKKLEEIQKVLDEEIFPKLDHYRKEKKKFLEFQNVSKQLEHTRGLVVAYEYKRNEEKLSRSDADLKEKEARIAELVDLAKELKKRVAEIGKLVDEIEKKKRKDGGRFEELDNVVKEHSKQLVKVKTQYDLKQSSLADEEASRDQINANVTEVGRDSKIVDGQMDSFSPVHLHRSNRGFSLRRKRSLRPRQASTRSGLTLRKSLQPCGKKRTCCRP